MHRIAKHRAPPCQAGASRRHRPHLRSSSPGRPRHVTPMPTLNRKKKIPMRRASMPACPQGLPVLSTGFACPKRGVSTVSRSAPGTCGGLPVLAPLRGRVLVPLREAVLSGCRRSEASPPGQVEIRRLRTTGRLPVSAQATYRSRTHPLVIASRCDWTDFLAYGRIEQ